MADLQAIKQSAHIVYDEAGQPVVQIPLHEWEELWAELEPKQPSQIEQIQALLKQWESEPDDTPTEWWEEFDAFLRENPVTFGNPDMVANDE
jgi:hypothetical protein